MNRGKKKKKGRREESSFVCIEQEEVEDGWVFEYKKK